MFKRVALLLMITVISSCGFCQQEVELPEAKANPVEILEEQKNSKKGIVLYKPEIPLSNDSLSESPKDEICEYETYRYSSDPFEIKSKAIQNVYIHLNEEFNAEVMLWARNKAREAKYVFIADNLTYTAAGDSLEFIDWAIIDIANQEIMWAQEFNDFNKKMSFNGTINLRDYLMQEKITFNLSGRAKSPSQKTYIGFYIDFIFLSNCEET